MPVRLDMEAGLREPQLIETRADASLVSNDSSGLPHTQKNALPYLDIAV